MKRARRIGFVFLVIAFIAWQLYGIHTFPMHEEHIEHAEPVLDSRPSPL